jgi:geranylgeranyl reductase family protein
MPDFEICIVGAGPAGAATATLLARQGRRVALFDRARFPRDKVCGDGITPRGARALIRLGIYDAVRGAACAHRGVTIRGGEAHSFTIPFERDPGNPSELLVLPRLVLDNLLLEHARRSGATFFGDTKIVAVREEAGGECVLELADGTRVTCNVAVLATGAETQLLRRSEMLAEKPALEHAARAYFENIVGLDDNVTLFFDGVDMPGYGWIFPVSATSANIGCGVFDPRGARQSARLHQLITEHPLLRRLLRGATQATPIAAYPLRTDFTPEFAGKSRRLCVGEAAGLVNPVTGEGIDYAFESAEFLADAVASEWQHSAAPSAQLAARYRASLARRFGLRFRLYRWIQKNCLSAHNTAAFLAKVEHSPLLQRCVVDGLFGRARPRDLLRPGVLWPALSLALTRRVVIPPVDCEPEV